jgi:hypothetical protein
LKILRAVLLRRRVVVVPEGKVQGSVQLVLHLPVPANRLRK